MDPTHSFLQPTGNRHNLSPPHDSSTATCQSHLPRSPKTPCLLPHLYQYHFIFILLYLYHFSSALLSSRSIFLFCFHFYLFIIFIINIFLYIFAYIAPSDPSPIRFRSTASFQNLTLDTPYATSFIDR